MGVALAEQAGGISPLAPSYKQFVVAKADSTAHRLWVFRFMVVKGWPMSYTCFAWAEGRATLGSSPEPTQVLFKSLNNRKAKNPTACLGQLPP